MRLLHMDEDGGIGSREKPVILKREGIASLEDIRTLYGLNEPADSVTVENVETAEMLLSNEIATGHNVFSKSNAQAAMHAVVLFRDLLLGDQK